MRTVDSTCNKMKSSRRVMLKYARTLNTKNKEQFYNNIKNANSKNINNKYKTTR